MRVHRSHPQIREAEIVVTALVFDCAQCGETDTVRGACVQADGSLRCTRCDNAKPREFYRWCPQCKQAKRWQAQEFESRRDAHERGRHQWCASCAAEQQNMTRCCERCAHEFTAKRRDARFCSTRCRVAAHRAS